LGVGAGTGSDFSFWVAVADETGSREVLDAASDGPFNQTPRRALKHIMVTPNRTIPMPVLKDASPIGKHLQV
jgi:hypothetical protein